MLHTVFNSLSIEWLFTWATRRSILAMSFVSATFLVGCGGLCETDITQTVFSPSGTLKAVVFSRDCGATTGFNTQVSILRANESLSDEGGNTLIVSDSVPIGLHWSSDSALNIRGIGGMSPIKQNFRVSGVEVTYAN
ncbi:MAG TPA: hypothetical protein VFK88_03520 [Gallionella sp.]|nr:hypothetical protein [Gallionella sp.]